jgi:maltose O-acetyltransferase
VNTHRSEKEKMLAGELYSPTDAEIQADLQAAKDWLTRYNDSAELSKSERWRLLQERLAEVGDGVEVRPPFYCDFGFNIRLGADVFVNFNCVLLDVNEIVIGDRTQVGPAVQIYAADHPRDAKLRRQMLEVGRRVRIGHDVWIGGGTIILPGVSVGNNAIIGAGSVVTRDVPEGVTVMGNPARVRRGAES